MARVGTGGNYANSSNTFAAGAGASFSFHVWVRGGAAPSAARITFASTFRSSTGAGTNPDFGIAWDHTNASYRPAVFNRRASNTYNAAKFTTALQANTWYSMVGTFDGTNLRAWLNGINEATVTSAAGANNAVTNYFMADPSNASVWTDGNVAGAAFWPGVVLAQAEITSLARGFSPKLIRPASLASYVPFIRSANDLKRGALTNVGTPVYSAHPPVLGG